MRLEVRFVDVDAFGHVNNAHYLTYFEQARVKALHQPEDLPEVFKLAGKALQLGHAQVSMAPFKQHAEPGQKLVQRQAEVVVKVLGQFKLDLDVLLGLVAPEQRGIQGALQVGQF